MTKIMQQKWAQRIEDLQVKVGEMKAEAGKEMPNCRVGCHPIVNGLAAIEGLAWGLSDAISRFPTEEAIEQDKQLGLL